MRALALIILTSCQVGLTAGATLPPTVADRASCEQASDRFEICRTVDGQKIWWCTIGDGGPAWTCMRIL